MVKTTKKYLKKKKKLCNIRSGTTVLISSSARHCGNNSICVNTAIKK